MSAPFRNQTPHIVGEGDMLLADVAARVQLPPGQYAVAEGRYQTLAGWIERDGSPLQGLVARVYGQGSVSYGAMVANRATNDEYDVDALVELLVREDADPQWVLDTLFQAVAGEPGSRYHGMVFRHTRCVQVRYADRMHVDLTPAVLRRERPERESTIFHHRHETPGVPGTHVIANPYGFAEWFKRETPPDLLLAMAFDGFEELRKARAETEPLPVQNRPHQVSRALLSLQLIKRFRNLRFDRREARCPPSILLAKQVAEHKLDRPGLGEGLLSFATYLRDTIKRHVDAGLLLFDYNPACPADVLTDRWPSSLADERVWLGDLEHLVARLQFYVRGEPTLAARQAILADLFGEHAAKAAVEDFAVELGRTKELGGSRYMPGTGKLVLPVVPLALPRGRPEPQTSYFGGDRPWPRR